MRGTYIPRSLDLLYERWRRGETSNEDTLKLFQRLIDENWAWRMPQHAQREVARAVGAGLVTYDGPIPPHALDY